MSDTDEKAPKKNVLKRVLALFQDANDWVQKAVGDDDARRSILMDLGLPTALPAGTPPKAYPQSDLPGINKYRQQEEPDATAFLEAVADIKTMYEAGRAFVRAYQESEGGSDEALLDEIAHRFFELIALNFLRNHCPALYWPARALGFIEETLSLHGSGKTYPERLSSFFRDVGGHFTQIGGGLDNHAEAEAWTDTLLSVLAVALAFAKSDWLSAGVNHMFYGWDPTPNSPTPLADKVSSRAVSFAYEGKTASFVLVPREHGGPGILLAVGGTFAFDLPLPGDWDLHVEVSAPAALDLLVRFDRLDATPDASRPKVQFALRKRPAPKAPAASTRSLSATRGHANDHHSRSSCRHRCEQGHPSGIRADDPGGATRQRWHGGQPGVCGQRAGPAGWRFLHGRSPLIQCFAYSLSVWCGLEIWRRPVF